MGPFTRNLELNENLNTEQNTKMLEFLYQNRDIFVTEDIRVNSPNIIIFVKFSKF
jgi:hypothetical protein